MQIPVLIGIIITFVIWLQYEIRRTKRLSKIKQDSYWKLEYDSNFARRRDISNLDYITIPLDQLSLSDREDSTINSYRDTILALSEKKLLNLTGITNTDLKYQYGASNISLLSEYDNNYTILVSILHKWGDRLYSQGYVLDAITVLEFAVSCYSDVSKSYILLASIYLDQNTPEKIDDLISKLPHTKMLRKDILIEELKKIKCL